MKEQAKDFVEIMKKVRPNMVFSSDIVNSSGVPARQHRDHEKWVFADKFGNFEALRAMTSVGGELALLSGRSNPYPHKLGVIEEGAYADMLLVDGNPLEDIAVIGGNPKWFDAAPRARHRDHQSHHKRRCDLQEHALTRGVRGGLRRSSRVLSPIG